MKVILFFCLLPAFLFAQSAEDFYVSFPASTPQLSGDSVKIWIHVPANYPTSGGGVMVALHGLGDPDNSPDIRTYLTATSDNLGLLLVCPEPYLGQEDSTLLAKSKAVVNETMGSIYAWYNTDLNQTYLCGYSAGSDVAAHYTLENPAYPVKGLIWFAPGFYGSLLAPNIDTAFSASIPPICMCRGTSDQVSASAATKIETFFSGSDVSFLKVSPAGIAHTMNYPGFTSDMATCLNFINEKSTTGFATIDLLEVKVFPNPASDRVYIETSNHAELYLELINVLGGILMEKQFPAGVSTSISLSSLQNGIYFVRITDNAGKVAIKKLIKE